MPARIALFTDFGSDGPYTGQLRLLLQGLAPGIPVVELVSDIAPFRPDLAAYFLPRLTLGMPGETVYLCVVDPGVGSEREALVMKAGSDWYVGPDNGLLAVAAASCGSDVLWWRVDWRPRGLSDSFHARDLFAPLAARIALGERVPGIVLPSHQHVGADWPSQSRSILYRDVYGNLCTGVHAPTLDRERVVIAGGWEIRYARTFSCVPEGEVFWYQNAFGLVELAVNCGRADEVLGIHVGDEVVLR